MRYVFWGLGASRISFDLFGGVCVRDDVRMVGVDGVVWSSSMKSDYNLLITASFISSLIGRFGASAACPGP